MSGIGNFTKFVNGGMIMGSQIIQPDKTAIIQTLKQRHASMDEDMMSSKIEKLRTTQLSPDHNLKINVESGTKWAQNKFKTPNRVYPISMRPAEAIQQTGREKNTGNYTIIASQSFANPATLTAKKIVAKPRILPKMAE